MIASGSDWNQPYSCESWGSTFGLTYPIVDDDQTSPSIWSMFGQGYIPHNVILGHDGEVIYSEIGFSEDGVIAAIEAGLTNMPSDNDSDEILNHLDNCPETYNPDQADVDSDGAGDACDACDNVNVYVMGNVTGDADDNGPILDVMDVLYLLDLILADEYPGCTGEVADYFDDENLNFMDALFLAHDIMNPGNLTSRGFYGGNGHYGLDRAEEKTLITFFNDQQISGFQIDLDVDVNATMDQLVIPDGWVVKTHQNNERLRIVGIDITGQNSQSEIKLTIPCNVSSITAINASSPTGQQINFSEKSTPDRIEIPRNVSLGQLYPNPFNPEISIPLTLPNEMPTQIMVFDVQGSLVETLLNNDHMTAGHHILKWNAESFASGIYFIRIQTPISSDVRKAYLIK
ncbi:MAG: T9SS type A sorting domain-containing protein [Candidatus Marinimicrobia bacterium]|nr:T9SS type A sorting domain-containing protein [Candidatus Neomarinimicrobiota bacterium]